MKRIGEILVESGFVTAAALERALAKQREIPRRLCSLLIARDVIDVDIASRALAEQYGVPAALQKHLDNRDKDLAALFPAELARSWCMLPLGRTGKGALIVCARDPSPAALAAVTALVKGTVVLAVAPASLLETLVAEAYGTAEDDFEVDLTTGPIHSLDLDPIPADRRRAPSEGGFGSLQLVELDDQAVSRDLNQSGSIQIGPSRQIPLPPSSAGITVPPFEQEQTLPRAVTPPARIVEGLPAGPRALASQPRAAVEPPPPVPPPAAPPEPPAEPPPVVARTVTPPIIVIPPKRPSRPSDKLRPVIADVSPSSTPTITLPSAPAPAPAPAPTEAPKAKFVRVDTDVGAAPAAPRRPAPTAPPPGVITRRPPTMPPPAAALGARPIQPAPPPRPVPPVRASPTTPPPPPANPHPFERPPSVPPIELAPPEFDATAIAAGTEPPRKKAITVPPTTIASALDAVGAAKTTDDLTAAAIRFGSGRWRAVLLFEVRDKIAAGEAGYGQMLGEDVVVALAFPLAVPSLVSQAVERGVLATEPPDSPVQDRLERLLGVPRFPAAMPISVQGKRRYVMAVGDPIAGDTDTAMQDLEKLAGAMGAAFTKLSP